MQGQVENAGGSEVRRGGRQHAAFGRLSGTDRVKDLPAAVAARQAVTWLKESADARHSRGCCRDDERRHQGGRGLLPS